MPGHAEELLGFGYAGGSASPEEIQAALVGVWSEALAETVGRSNLAAALQVDEAALDDIGAVPFRVRQASANIDPALVHLSVEVLAWIGLNVFGKAAADLAKEEVKRRMQAAWIVLEPRLRASLRFHRALGER